VKECLLTHRKPRHRCRRQEPFDGLLPHGRGNPLTGEVALGQHRTVGERQLQRPHALLLGHEASDAAVHL